MVTVIPALPAAIACSIGSSQREKPTAGICSRGTSKVRRRSKRPPPASTAGGLRPRFRRRAGVVISGARRRGSASDRDRRVLQAAPRARRKRQRASSIFRRALPAKRWRRPGASRGADRKQERAHDAEQPPCPGRVAASSTFSFKRRAISRAADSHWSNSRSPSIVSPIWATSRSSSSSMPSAATRSDVVTKTPGNFGSASAARSRSNCFDRRRHG